MVRSCRFPAQAFNISELEVSAAFWVGQAVADTGALSEIIHGFLRSLRQYGRYEIAAEKPPYRFLYPRADGLYSGRFPGPG